MVITTRRMHEPRVQWRGLEEAFLEQDHERALDGRLMIGGN